MRKIRLQKLSTARPRRRARRGSFTTLFDEFTNGNPTQRRTTLSTVAMQLFDGRGRIIGVSVHRHEASHWLTVAGNNDSLTAFDFLKQLAETRLCFIGSDCLHPD